MANEKRTLYEIDQAILDCLDAETGEILDFEQLEQLQVERDQKIEGVALYIKNLQAEAAAIKVEEDALKERRKAKEAKVAQLKEYLVNALEGQKFETASVCLSFRKSTYVDVSDAQELLMWLEMNGMESCIKYKAPEVSTSEVGKLLKAGKEIPGAVLAERSNLQMK